MRSIGGVSWLLVIVGSGCGGAGAPAPASESTPAPAPEAAARAAEAATAAPAGVLPAGLYFRDHVYKSICEDCAAPTAAAVAGVYGDAAAAQAAVARVAAMRLAPGYPLVLHSDDLGFTSAKVRGVAVILGLFRTTAEARGWLTSANPPGGSRVLALLDADAAFARLDAQRGDTAGIETPRIVRIDAGPPAPAWSRRELDAWHDAENSGEPPDPYAAEPACTIAPGTIFLLDREEMWRYDPEHLPVTCPGGEPALVRKDRTLLDAAIIARPDGTAELHQVMSVTCDHPDIQTWTYHPTRGRTRTPPGPRLAARGGC